MKKYLVFFPLILFLMLVFFLWRGLSINPNKIPSTLINQPAPEFTLPSLDKSKLLTNALFRQHVTLLNVWASWCLACQAEHEVLLLLAQQAQLQIIGWDYKDRREDAKRYLEENGNPFHEVIWDHEGRAAVNWGIYGTPETFMIDKHGVIRYKHVGPLSDPGVKEEILLWLEKLAHE